MCMTISDFTRTTEQRTDYIMHLDGAIKRNRLIINRLTAEIVVLRKQGRDEIADSKQELIQSFRVGIQRLEVEKNSTS